MFLTRTPLRISLFGGGTDLPAFCSKHPGHVITGAIDKYVYVAMKKRFDGRIRACYSTTEIVDRAADLKHDRIREVLLHTGIEGVDVVSFSDVPPRGIGLGSSSAFTVGLLHAAYACLGVKKERYELAADACRIEIEKCGSPIGRQDQYATALGGLRELTFTPGTDTVGTFEITNRILSWSELHSRLLLFYTGLERNGDAISSETSRNASESPEAVASLVALAALANKAGNCIYHFLIDRLGPMMDEAWRLKKCCASSISNPDIDRWYAKAREAGAWGGKCCGAGGGGFMVFMAPPRKHADVIAALSDVRHVPFGWDCQGTQLIYGE
jgi:D-glycero-alpha-D-manno-heptose-7-phosphate kinase